MTQQTDRLNAALAGRYRIERHLGEGGMATVYLAEDLRHDRKVALKLLKPELAAVLGAERFVQEIKTTAALSHPHILPLFDSGTADGFLFYVMPYIQGETIREKLNRETQFGVDEAVRITREVADALDYAHRNGVIHRDIKPENILLHDGRPMVMDFGIAIAVSAAAGGRMTETGLSLGTPHYMSPEQATAEKEITARSDVYSLGSVLYEMLTGNPPHTGASAQQIIMRIITDPVRPVTEVRRAVPPNVAAAVAKSLEKLPADRFENAKAFAEALANPAFAGTTAHITPGAVRGGARGFRRPLLAALGLVAAGGIGAAAWVWTHPEPELVPKRFEIPLPDSVSLARAGGWRISLSRDGTKVLFAGFRGGKRGLYLRRMDETHAQLVRGTEGVVQSRGAINASFSPDGEWIIFRAEDQGFKKIAVTGGTAQSLADSVNSASWGDGDKIVYLNLQADKLLLGTPNGRDARLLSAADSAHRVANFATPKILPGGHHALVTIYPERSGTRGTARLAIVSLDDGKVSDLGVTGFDARYVTSGHLIFARDGDLLFTVPFSLRRLAVTGSPTLLLENVPQPPAAPNSTYDISDDGMLVHAEGTARFGRYLVRVGMQGDEHPLGVAPQGYEDPRLSPDGRTVAVAISEAGMQAGTVWLADVASGKLERLSAGGAGFRPDWTRDGKRVAFFRDSAGKNSILSSAADRSSAEVVLAPQGVDGATEMSLGPAHGFAAIRMVKKNNRDIYIAPMDSLSATRPFVATAFNEFNPAISPDGRLLAYVSDENRRTEVYVQAIPGPGARVQVSVNGGTEPVWSPSGGTLFFRGPSRIMSAVISPAPLKVVKTDSLFVDVYNQGSNHQFWSVFPSGREFLMIRGSTGYQPIIAIVNWQQLRRQKAAAPAGR